MSLPEIFIAADFLFTKESEQFNNRRWLKDLLHRPVAQAAGRAPGSFATSLTDKSKMSRKRFFELSQIKVNEGATQFWFDAKKVSQASIDYLNEFLPAGSVVIAYELAEATREVLQRAGVHYVDLWLHPVRFYDDVLFGVSSGTRTVYDAMKQFHLADENFWLYADRLRIQLYKGWRRDELQLPANSALLVGQTLEDKAICRDGKMLSLLDFKAEVEQLSAQHERVFFSRHPFVKTGDEEVLKWLQSLPNVELTSVPSYHLIANQSIKKVAAISSSVVHEARFFGKKTEFYYKPVFTFGQRFGKDYLTVYQEFVSPHFWAAALASVVPTHPCPRVMFAEGKDKIRDMLAFYWAWPTVDKTEAMRVKLNAVASKVHEIGKSGPAAIPGPAADETPLPVHEPGLTKAGFLADAARMMRSVDVVTFDVFDTVLERPFENYETLFELIAPEVKLLTGIPEEAFIDLRRRSRALAESRKTGEEIPLAARYGAVLEAAGCPQDTSATLAAYEFGADFALLRPRPLGKELYELAVSMGKRIAFVSDIYYSTKQVRALLDGAGFDRVPSQVFTSCDEGLLKHSGTLYPHVLQALRVDAAQVLHIGDNLHSDVEMARQSGLHALHLPQAGETFAQRSHLSSQLKFDKPITQSVVRGLVAKKFFDVPGSGLGATWAGGQPRQFGYAVAGPMMHGFAQWVLSQAAAQGLDRVYFLARDGDIVKQVYDALARTSSTPAVPSKYLLASRRSVNVAAVRSLEDALALLSVNFTPCSVGALLRARYGLELRGDEPGAEGALQAAGYQGLKDTADFKLHQARLKTLVTKLWPLIDENCKTERQALLAYYQQEGLLDEGRFAVVDIGHNGTMQMSLSELTGKALDGFYFVTYAGIKDVHARGLRASGYVAQGLDGKASKHPYANYLLMFEMLFLNDKGSFVRMKEKGGVLSPVFQPLDGEASRVAFIRQVHEGAVEFAQDASRACRGLPGFEIKGPESIAAYVAMLRNPSVPDARMFEGVAFENVYSGRDARFILAPERSGEESVWREGDALLQRWRFSQQRQPYPLTSWLVKRCCPEAKWIKFKKNPERFFAESKLAPVRFLGRFYASTSR